MKLFDVGPSGIGVALTLAGMDVPEGGEFDRIEITMNEDGLRCLKSDIEFFDSAKKRGPCHVSVPLYRRKGMPVSLRIRYEASVTTPKGLPEP